MAHGPPCAHATVCLCVLLIHFLHMHQAAAPRDFKAGASRDISALTQITMLCMSLAYSKYSSRVNAGFTGMYFTCISAVTPFEPAV